MKKPNFFIVGAPKCGTTSLAAWLSDHSQVYMSPVKEIHYFNTDKTYLATQKLELYEKLFSAATTSHKAVGEASVWYLRSTVAVANIERYSPDARYIVCLRNPIEMAYSLHEQQLVGGNENIVSFEDAWRLHEIRMKGESVSMLCQEPRNLAYGNACKLGDQLERILHRVGHKRVLPILLDDVKDSPRNEYRKILAFLNIDDDGRTEFPVHNAAKERRSPFFRKMVMVAGLLKRRLGIYRGLGILNKMDKMNLHYRKREPMSTVLRLELQEYFRSDVGKLSVLLDRDLSGWLKS